MESGGGGGGGSIFIKDFGKKKNCLSGELDKNH
jgi:hypothetical protein